MNSRLYWQIVVCTLGLAVAAAIIGMLVAGGPGALASWPALTALLTLVAAAGAAAHFVARGVMRKIEHQVRDGKARSDEAAARVQQAGDEIQRLSSILQSMADGVIAVDDRLRILLANNACLEMLRINTTPVVGRPLLEVSRARGLYDTAQQALARPGALTTELTLGDEAQQHLLLRASQLPGDPAPGVVVVLHDVTEVRRLESIRKEFVANVSHELKTPLASIKAYAETLRLGAINDTEHNVGFVTRIEEEANRLSGLITDMLQIARIESHQQAFSIEAVDLQAQVETCVHNMAGRAGPKEIALQITPPTDPVYALADEDAVQTILTNLLDNAIKYTPDGGKVTIGWKQLGDHVVLTVEDTGMGIEPEHQNRIFERFFRVDRARNRDSGGTGLGLSIVKHLVQALEGTVSVNSKLGQGSRFEVALPIKSEPPPTA
mgnify:CR=1 FL=1